MSATKSDILVGIIIVSVTMQLSEAPPPPGGGGPAVYSRELEEALRESLFTTNNYQVLQRPSEKVEVQVSLSLLTVNDLDIRDQTLSLTGFFTFYWQDSRLEWSTDSTYDNIRFLFSTETYVWRPPLIIENSVEDVSIISDKNIPMRFNNRGLVTWNPAGIYKVACEADTRFYPMDIQSCNISITAWAYTQNEISLRFKDDPFDLTFYSTNGEWQLVSTETILPEAIARGGQSFSGLDFQIKLRRRPMFHILNTLFPVALMGILSAMVFKLPADSGEKIGFSLTILLAYTVYLTLISENIPSTSVTLCYLSLYLALTLSLGSLSVLCTIVVLNVYFRSDVDEPIPGWLKQLTSKVLMRVACYKNNCCCVRMNDIRIHPASEISSTEQGSLVLQEVEQADITKKTVRKRNKKLDEQPLESASISPSSSTAILMVEEAGDDLDLTWKELAVILDRLFFLLFMSTILLSTATLFYLILGEWINVEVSNIHDE
ncbi:neuronal acetylcholine receptor subunit beta-2-like [Mizuhopecten yessoensis]|uniref:neuronal acetylcholine receptor subunit beta-2-like n=1 Tax=Mizuhopecten yessoensis TaxID=6573 RepID=UPI000B45CDF0|nr:neuronal acetylcholine receptor subunit beta-2-like [Mizuhopecten yessoensis]